MSTEVGALQASLTLDISDFISKMTGAIKEVKAFGSAMQKALGADSTQGFSAIQKQLDILGNDITALKANMMSLINTMNTNTGASMFAEVANNTSRLKTGLDEAADSANRLGMKMEDFYNAGAVAAATVEDIGKKQKEVTKHTRSTGAEVKNNARAMKQVVKHTVSWSTELKRIVSGILISQTFYALAGYISQIAVDSATFMTNMEQSAIAYKYLLGSAEKSSTFLQLMQDFAIKSPLDTQGVIGMSRKLLAMGFAAESVLPTLTTLADASAVYSSSATEQADTMRNIVVALGQMKAAGKVSAQELKQLYNAGVPIYTILQEQLGLTTKQIKNIGKYGVDSAESIVAILDWMNKHYAGAAEEMTQTVSGAMSAIKDSIFAVTNIAFGGFYEKFRQFVVDISNSLTALVKIARVYGAGGIFQAIFPEDMWMPLRNVIGSLRQLGSAVSYLGKIFSSVFNGIAEVVINVLSVVLPPISILANALAQLAYWVYANVPFVKQLLTLLTGYVVVVLCGKAFIFLWNAVKLGAICASIGKIIIGLVDTIKVATAAVWAFAGSWTIAVGVIIAALILIAAFSKRSQASLKKMWDSWQNMFKGTSSSGLGFDPNKIAAINFKKPDDSATEFLGTIGDVNTAIDDVAATAADTAKAISESFNQAFDEVYTIDPNSKNILGISGLADTNFGDIQNGITGITDAMKGLDDWTGDFNTDWGNLLDGLGADNFKMPDMNWSTLAGDFWKTFLDAFSAPEWVGLGLGALIGAVIGGILGGPAGALIGAAIGGLALYVAGLFWPEIKKAFGLTDSEGIGIVLAGAIGGIIGGLIGGPGGAVIGAAIGILVGDLGGLLYNGFVNGDWDIPGLSLSIGGVIGAAIGAIIGGPAGAIIGGAIGVLVGDVIGKIYTGFKTGDWDAAGISMSLAMLICTAIGGIIGGPAGAAIGAAIGLVVDDIIAQLADGFQATDLQKISIPTGTLIGAAIGACIGGPVGAVIGAAIGTLVGWIVKTIQGDMDKDLNDRTFKHSGQNIMEGLRTGMTDGMPQVLIDIYNWCSKMLQKVKDFFGIASPAKTMMPLGENIILGLAEGFIPGMKSLLSSLDTHCSDIKTQLSGWWDETLTGFSNWAKNIWDSVSDWFDKSIDKVKDFLGLSNEDTNVTITSPTKGIGVSGHAKGGIYDKEHIANFAEDNKAEAIIPLENKSGMTPFVDAVSTGIVSALAPFLAQQQLAGTTSGDTFQIGTLIGDERSLKELWRKVKVIQAKEEG